MAGDDAPPPVRGGWREIYRDLIASGRDLRAHRTPDDWLEPALELAGPPEGRRAVDLGCGLGSDLLRLTEAGWCAEGLDGETAAAEFVTSRYGIPVTVADLHDALPWPDAHFGLVTSRLALHVLDPDAAARTFAQIARVLEPGGVLAFAVNAASHRELGLQYDYRGAVEVAPDTWYLPGLDRRYLFYTPDRARRMLEDAFEVVTCEEREIEHFGIRKRVVTCVARRRPDTTVGAA